MLTVLSIPALKDNYIWLIKNPANECVIVDPGDAKPVLEIIKKYNLVPTGILLTHHHYDHVDGVPEILSAFSNMPVYGPNIKQLPFVSHPLTDKQTFRLLNTEFHAFETPGHTQDHLSFLAQDMLFCGDTLFSAGCGRLFEGTPKQMLTSLDLLASLPNNTRVYSAHEYTQSNIAFALSVDPTNEALKKHADKVANLRAKKETTLPSNIGLEKQINPFLRVRDKNIIFAVKNRTEGLEDHDIFAALRSLKDQF
jgi:hydroxyacylglutathione hydrolase